MSIDLTTLVTKKYPPHRLYIPGVRIGVDPKSDPPSSPPPYASLMQRVTIIGEETIERVTVRHAAAFPARARIGQMYTDERTFGTRLGALHYPEQHTGSLLAASI